MRVVIAGGHGQIALLLEKVLADRGDAPVGIVRNPDHVEDLEKAGAEAVVLDLEERRRRRARRRCSTAPTPWCSRPAAGPNSGVGPQGDRGQGRRGAARRRGGAGRRTPLRDGLVDGHRQGRPGQRRRVPGLPAGQEGRRRRPAGARPRLDRRPPRPAHRRPRRRPACRSARWRAARSPAPTWPRSSRRCWHDDATDRHDVRPARRAPDDRGGARRAREPRRCRRVSRRRC